MNYLAAQIGFVARYLFRAIVKVGIGLLIRWLGRWIAGRSMRLK